MVTAQTAKMSVRIMAVEPSRSPKASTEDTAELGADTSVAVSTTMVISGAEHPSPTISALVRVAATEVAVPMPFKKVDHAVLVPKTGGIENVQVRAAVQPLGAVGFVEPGYGTVDGESAHAYVVVEVDVLFTVLNVRSTDVSEAACAPRTYTRTSKIVTR